jgi:hypothetical protein
MISIFNNNRIVLGVVLLLLTFLLSMVVLVNPEWYVLSDFQSPFYSLLVDWLKRISGNNFYFFFIISLALIFIQAIVINRFVNDIKLFPKITYVPGLLYILCASLFREYLFFNPVLIVNTFIVLIVIKMFSVYKKADCHKDIFDVGLMIGICALIYFPSLSLLLLFFIGLSILRPFAWREWVIGIIGVLVPFFLAGTVYFLNDKLAKFFLATFESVYAEFNVAIEGGPELVWIGGEIVIMLGIAVYLLQNNFMKSPIQFRKFLTLMLWGIVILAFSSLFLNKLTLNHFLILSAPLSIILSYFFLSFRKWYIPETFFWSLFLSILAFQYLK